MTRGWQDCRLLLAKNHVFKLLFISKGNYFNLFSDSRLP